MPPRRKPSASLAAPAAPASAAGDLYGDPAVHLPGFLQYLRAEAGMAANSISAYRSDLLQFIAWFRKQPEKGIQGVELAALTRYVAHLHQRGLAPSSVGRHLVSVKMFFRYLVLEGVLRESVADLLTSPKLWQHLPTVLSPDRVNRLLMAPTFIDRFRLRDRALLALMYATGCRASEVCALTVANVHLAESYCRCVGKGNKERLVSLNPVAVSAVEAYLAEERRLLVRTTDPGTLLLSRQGKPLSRIMVWQLVKKYSARIGCSADVSPHTLRHSFATHMLAGGAEIRALQELLGHASIATTQIYTQVEHSRLKSIHQKHHPRG